MQANSGQSFADAIGKVPRAGKVPACIRCPRESRRDNRKRIPVFQFTVCTSWFARPSVQKMQITCQIMYTGTILGTMSVSGFIPENYQFELSVSVSVRFGPPGI